MKRLLLAAQVSCLALMMGCPIEIADEGMNGDGDGDGDRDGPGNGPVSSGVDEDLPLDGLKTDDAQQLCDWANAKFAEIDALFAGEKGCTIAALGYAASADECREVEMQCLADPNQGAPGDGIEEEGDDDCAASLQAEVAGCDVTVDELQTCIQDELSAALAFIDSLTCDVAGQEIAEPAEPESCQALAVRCPQAFEGGVSDGDDGDGPGDPGDPSDGFICPDGASIPAEYVCDGEADCADGFDEQFCESPGEGALCSDESVIAYEQICDGTPDCPEGEDEAYCGEVGPGDGEATTSAYTSHAAVIRSLSATRLFR